MRDFNREWYDEVTPKLQAELAARTKAREAEAETTVPIRRTLRGLIAVLRRWVYCGD